MEDYMNERHEHRYVRVTHKVRTLDGVAEDLVQLRCSCGAVEAPPAEGPGPKLGEWI